MDAANTHAGDLSQHSTILSVKMSFPNVSPTSSMTQLRPSLPPFLYFKMVSRLMILEFPFTGQFSWSSDNFWCSIIDGGMYHFAAYWQCNNQLPKNDPYLLLTGWLPQLDKKTHKKTVKQMAALPLGFFFFYQGNALNHIIMLPKKKTVDLEIKIIWSCNLFCFPKSKDPKAGSITFFIR